MARFTTTPPPFVALAAHPLRWRLMTELARSDLRVRDLVALVDEPQNLVSYHLRLMRDGGLVTATRSSYDGRDSYYHLDLDRCAHALADTGAALHPALRPGPETRPTHIGRPRVAVLFVCTGNSARSPIAEALLLLRGAGRVNAASAGTRPKPRIHPDAVRVLHDRYGIDITGRHTRAVDAVTRRRFDYMITLCDKAREVRPELRHRPRLAHWSIPDPDSAADGYPAFERTAAEIDTRIRYLLPTLTHSESSALTPSENKEAPR
jgi:protein-tyrosine-phosphatase/DNA-binding transcriptional ArsR family regulator